MAKIKVSEKTVAQLRKGTMAGNLAKAKGASPEMREALLRFYGAKRVTAAIGKSGPGSTGKPKPFTPKPNDREGRKPALMSPKPSGGPGAKNVRPKPPMGGPGAKPVQPKASSSVKPMSKAEQNKAIYDKGLKGARAQAAEARKKAMKK